MNEYIEDLEHYLGVKVGFFFELQSEDDWTCIIKLFSLLEASTSSMIAEHLLHPDLADAFSFIQMGTTSNGKLQFIKILKLLPDRYIRFIETLGWVRNKYAHNISTSKEDIKSFILSISSNRRRECERNLQLIESAKINEEHCPGNALFKDNPRVSIFISCQVVLEYIRQMTIAGQQSRRIRKELADKHLKEHEPIRIDTSDYKLEQRR